MTAANPYTTRSSVIRRLAIGGIPTTSALAASSLAGSETVTLDGHGFETGDPLTVRAITGGALSAPLVAGTTYYAIRLDNASFKLSATPTGAAIDLTTDAVEMMVMRDPDFDYWIGVYSRWADTNFPGHAVPFTPGKVPSIVESLTADLVAKRMFNVGGQASDSLKDMEITSAAQLARFATGMPIRDAAATAPTNLAINAALSTGTDPRGWCPNGSGVLP